MDKLPRNPKEFRRKLVDSKKEIDGLWERLTKNTKELEPKADMRYILPIYRWELDTLMLINACHIDKLDEILFINTPNPTYISEYINVIG